MNEPHTLRRESGGECVRSYHYLQEALDMTDLLIGTLTNPVV